MMTRDDVRAAIRFQGPSRPPRAFSKWWGDGLRAQHGDKLKQFDKYEDDVVIVAFPYPWYDPREDGFYWHVPQPDISQAAGLDSSVRHPDWADLHVVLDNLPNTELPYLFDEAKRVADAAHTKGKYVLVHHWSLMYERIWTFRGMENLLMDYYDYPDEVHALHRAVADTEIKLLHRAFREVKPDVPDDEPCHLPGIHQALLHRNLGAVP